MATIIQPRRLNVRKTIFVGSVLVAFFIYTYFIRDPKIREIPPITGGTMGTTYEIKIANSPMTVRRLQELARDIRGLLQGINRQMSTYIEDSGISEFNRSRSTEPYTVPKDFAKVVSYAQDLAGETAGAFDPTLGPLIRRWGFGHTSPAAAAPKSGEIRELMERCGYSNLLVLTNQQIQKRVPGLELNLSAIAKGYAVDAVFRLLTVKGLRHVYVEIGGETRVLGLNPGGNPWRIGLEYPAAELAPGESFAAIIAGTNMSIAASGDYRNQYVDSSGVTRNHIIDSRSGKPTTNGVASATVIARTCMNADGAATALMVMGPETGLEWIEGRQSMEALLLVRGDGGTLAVHESSGFRRYAEEVFLSE